MPSKIINIEILELFDNPIAEEPNYKLRVIHKIPSLHVFDRHGKHLCVLDIIGMWYDCPLANIDYISF